MKKWLIFVLVLSFSSIFLATSLSFFAGKDQNFYDSFYLGVSLKTVGLMGLGVDLIYPISSYENYLEIDPYFYLNINIGKISLYSGIGGFALLNLSISDFEDTTGVYRGKIGVSFNMQNIDLFLETITIFFYPPFNTSSYYGLHGGLSLNF